MLVVYFAARGDMGCGRHLGVYVLTDICHVSDLQYSFCGQENGVSCLRTTLHEGGVENSRRVWDCVNLCGVKALLDFQVPSTAAFAENF